MEWWDEEEVKRMRTRMYYSKEFRTWVVYGVDSKGHQVGDAFYRYSKGDASAVKKDLQSQPTVKCTHTKPSNIISL